MDSFTQLVTTRFLHSHLFASEVAFITPLRELCYDEIEALGTSTNISGIETYNIRITSLERGKKKSESQGGFAAIYI